MRFSLACTVAAMAGAALASCGRPRNVIYYDQYHTTGLPDKNLTQSVTHVITAFANSSLFASDPAGVYEPFQPLDEVRSLFDADIKVCMAIGGWGDTAGLEVGAKDDASRKLFAKNIADTLDRLGYDCVDIDWEYPGGNGEDYRQVPNSEKAWEIDPFPILLQEIREAIGDNELSIAVPGREGDMIAYTAENIARINVIVDFVNVMSYDMMNRRDNFTRYHTSINDTLHTIDAYVSRGFEAHKLNIGVPFYAKWFTTKDGVDCTTPVGCPTELLEAADGSDTGLSGTTTFERGNFADPPTNLTFTTDGSCGVGTFFECEAPVQCCSQYGWCGNTTVHCGTGCQNGYGECEGTDIIASFKTALANGNTDVDAGAQWYWDGPTHLFWTWDTPGLITEKISTLFSSRGIGGVMAWSLAEDSYDWSHLKAMQNGFKANQQSPPTP